MLLALAAVPDAGQAQQRQRPVPSDSLSPQELVAEWEAEMSRPVSPERPVRTSIRRDGITKALWNYRLDPARAEAVRDELEKVAFRSTIPEVRGMAILKLSSGYNVGIPAAGAESADTRALARRLEAIYERVGSDPYLSRAVFSAVATLGGSGRLYALTWLEPLIVQETEAQAYPQEAREAMRTAANLGPEGRALVVRLREQGLIKDEETRFRSGFIRIEGR